jgi:hypothetical protein
MPNYHPWLFVGPHGRVKDWGGPQAVVSEDGELLFVIPRYGVWRPDAGGTLVVTDTTAQLEDAVRLASQPES